MEDSGGRLLRSDTEVIQRWKSYFGELMNIENSRENRLDNEPVRNRVVQALTAEETRNVPNIIKYVKAIRPDNIPVEVWKRLGECSVSVLSTFFNENIETEQMLD